MNEYDSNRIYDLVKGLNYFPTNNIDEADLLCFKYLSYKRKSD